MNIAIILATFLILNSCHSDEAVVPITKESPINLKHFDHLYKEIDFQGQQVGIVHIYSQYPDYEYAIEPSEGFTCVDDVARAIVLCSRYLENSGEDAKIYDQLEKMIAFVLRMQNENGYFNNFIWNDLSINTTYKTSVAELNWWSFRVLWALETAYPLVESNTELTEKIVLASEKLMTNIKQDLPINDLSTVEINTLLLPTWLPQKYASDQGALLILGLLKYYERTTDDVAKQIIEALAEGIMLMQKGGAENYPYGAFMSWENLWHAWGNNQAYSLLKAGQQLNNQQYIDSALKEVDNLYPYLLKNGFAEAFLIEKVGEDAYNELNRNKYPQITYGLRPMVWATLEAYQYSKDEKYKTLANDLEGWLMGKNIAQTSMYNSETGVCFDGIVAPNEVNKNSGAESTIESLLILLEMQKIK